MIIRGAASHAVFNDGKMGKANLVTGEHVFAGLNCFLPGQEHALHSHGGQDKLYFVLEGTGDVTVGNELHRASAGDLVLARESQPHAIRNPGPDNLVVLTVMAPPPGPRSGRTNPR